MASRRRCTELGEIGNRGMGIMGDMGNMGLMGKRPVNLFSPIIPKSDLLLNSHELVGKYNLYGG